jgi:hypothetical protein
MREVTITISHSIKKNAFERPPCAQRPGVGVRSTALKRLRGITIRPTFLKIANPSRELKASMQLVEIAPGGIRFFLRIR